MSEDLYRFQEDVFEAIASGKSVILQAPTGAGKTRAALAPFLYALVEIDAAAFPRKCIYSVPMKVLANQFIEVYQENLAYYTRVQRIEPKPTAAIQTGDRPDSPLFEDTLVFTTIDQTLASLLNIPYSLGSTRFDNLNAGAILSSYLVFDEFHLFGANTSLATTLQLLKLLNGVTPFILMTATFSRTLLDALEQELGDNVVVLPRRDAPDDYFADVPSQQAERRRVFDWHPVPLTAEEVAKNPASRIICICNTVARARELAAGLHDQPNLQDHAITVLHSQFFQADRDSREALIQDIFKNASGKGQPHILVATQVIEVGMDISCEVMHTELAPVNSLLQRAGRCARREGENGTVIVYEPPDSAPYYFEPEEGKHRREPDAEMRDNKILLDKTRAALASGGYTGRHMTFALEQQLINAVHGEVDAAMLRRLKDDQGNRLAHIFETIAQNQRGYARELIRESDTRYVIIHDDPDSDDKLGQYPWRYQGLGLRAGDIYKHWLALGEDHYDEDMPWLVREAIALPEEPEGEGQSLPRYKWNELKKPEELFSGTLALALHPAFARYTQHSGLWSATMDDPQVAPCYERQQAQRFYTVYERETYAEHIGGLYQAYKSVHWVKSGREGQYRPALRDEMAYTLQQLSRRHNLTLEQLDEVIRLMLAVHDLGKLSVAWQRFAHEWQHEVGQFYGQDRSLPSEYMAAHTDLDKSLPEHRDLLKKLEKKYPRGNHAGESAVACAIMLSIYLGKDHEPLIRAVLTAIARHHTPQVDDFSAFAFSPHARPAIHEALMTVQLEQLISVVEQSRTGIPAQVTKQMSLSNKLVRFSDKFQDEVILYLFLARLLRMADQRSFNARVSSADRK